MAELLYFIVHIWQETHLCVNKSTMNVVFLQFRKDILSIVLIISKESLCYYLQALLELIDHLGAGEALMSEGWSCLWHPKEE